MPQCFEFDAVNCQKKLGIFIRISITMNEDFLELLWRENFGAAVL